MSIDQKNTSYDSILIVVDRLKKILRNEPVQITIDAPALVADYTPLKYLLRGGPHLPYQVQVGIS